ncbi:MAG TPA: hypothetical protein PKM41_16330 [Deltaproteobacteria bacterium]|nr:hypothetical protein [Deltaproteobacteria bacterium]HOI08792.1 hypothetical protein [Deltaproteobacteria bacterium]
MKSYSIIAVTILAFFLVSCSRSDSLPESAKDAVDLAIVCVSQNTNLPHPELSDGLKQRLAKYNGNTNFELTCNGIGQKPEDVNGVHGLQIVMIPGAQFKCTYKGGLKHSVQFLSGEVGVVNKEIHVKEGSKISVDSKQYVFSQGVWKKAL